MIRLAILFIAAQASATLPLVNVSIHASNRRVACLIGKVNLALPKGWRAVTYVVSTIESADKTLASVTILARNPSQGLGSTFDLLVTSTDANGWAYVQAGSEIGIATYAMKPTAQLIQRRTATSLGVVDLSSCN